MLPVWSRMGDMRLPDLTQTAHFVSWQLRGDAPPLAAYAAQDAIFGVLYMINKERVTSKARQALGGPKYAKCRLRGSARLSIRSSRHGEFMPNFAIFLHRCRLQFWVILFYLVNYIQLLLFVMAPTWGWNLNYNNTFWRWFQRFQARWKCLLRPSFLDGWSPLTPLARTVRPRCAAGQGHTCSRLLGAEPAHLAPRLSHLPKKLPQQPSPIRRQPPRREPPGRAQRFPICLSAPEIPLGATGRLSCALDSRSRLD